MPMDATGLAARMEAELPGAWKELKHFDMPAGGDPADRKVMFLAVARGLLVYLSANEAAFLKSITFTGSNTPQEISRVDFDITLPP